MKLHYLLDIGKHLRDLVDGKNFSCLTQVTFELSQQALIQNGQ